MHKRAFNPADAWQGLRNNPITGTAMSIGSYMPIVGGAIGAGDMLNNLYRGNLASAGVNALQTAAGFLPGGKLVETLGKGGRIGQVAAKAVPWVAPLGADPSKVRFVHQLTSAVPQVGAQMVDQMRQMERPVYQKQLKDQEQTMREFNEWRRHKATLQQMAQQQPPQEPDVKEAADAHSVGEMGKKLWGLHTKALPYTGTAMMAGQMYPGYINEDIPGMLRGAVRGGGAVLGSMGGFMGGGLAGNALGAALASKLKMDPRMAGNIGAGVGGTLGTLLGHYTGRKTFGAAVDDEDSPMNFRRLLKSGSALLKAASADKERRHQEGQRRKAIGQIISSGGDPNAPPPPGNPGKAMMKRPGSSKSKPQEPKVEAPPAKVDPAAAELAKAGPAHIPPMPPPDPAHPPQGAVLSPQAAQPKPAQPQAAAPPPFTAPGIGDPARTGSFGGFPSIPTAGQAIMRHPMMAFANRYKIPLALGALGTAGAGAYLMGRSKRNKEDSEAEAAMAKQGFAWGGGAFNVPLGENVGAELGYSHLLGVLPYPHASLRFGQQEGPGISAGLGGLGGLHLGLDTGTKPGWAWKHPRSLYGRLLNSPRKGESKAKEKETPAANPDAVGENR